MERLFKTYARSIIIKKFTNFSIKSYKRLFNKLNKLLKTNIGLKLNAASAALLK